MKYQQMIWGQGDLLAPQLKLSLSALRHCKSYSIFDFDVQEPLAYARGTYRDRKGAAEHTSRKCIKKSVLRVR